jgi:hypothetical protein
VKGSSLQCSGGLLFSGAIEPVVEGVVWITNDDTSLTQSFYGIECPMVAGNISKGPNSRALALTGFMVGAIMSWNVSVRGVNLSVSDTYRQAKRQRRHQYESSVHVNSYGNMKYEVARIGNRTKAVSGYPTQQARA